MTSRGDLTQPLAGQVTVGGQAWACSFLRKLLAGPYARPAHCPPASRSHALEMPGAILPVRAPRAQPPSQEPVVSELSAPRFPHLLVTSDLPSLIPSAGGELQN